MAIDEPSREMYGKLMSVPDELMWKYYSYILCRPKEEVEQMRAQVTEGSLHPRKAKDNLAQAVVEQFE